MADHRLVDDFSTGWSARVHQFDYPEFLGQTPWLTFGRVRPVHVNGVIVGAFSTPVFGLLYYLVRRLCCRRMAKEHCGGGCLRRPLADYSKKT
jgi:cbb3-type cytochrome oxidase subunit 1